MLRPVSPDSTSSSNLTREQKKADEKEKSVKEQGQRLNDMFATRPDTPGPNDIVVDGGKVKSELVDEVPLEMKAEVEGHGDADRGEELIERESPHGDDNEANKELEVDDEDTVFKVETLEAPQDEDTMPCVDKEPTSEEETAEVSGEEKEVMNAVHQVASEEQGIVNGEEEDQQELCGDSVPIICSPPRDNGSVPAVREHEVITLEDSSDEDDDQNIITRSSTGEEYDSDVICLYSDSENFESSGEEEEEEEKEESSEEEEEPGEIRPSKRIRLGGTHSPVQNMEVPVVFDSASAFKDFSNDQNDCKQNFLESCAVHINVPGKTPTDWDLYWGEGLKLLSAYGLAIKILTIDLGDHPEICAIGGLAKVLFLTPNVEKLTIIYKDDPAIITTDTELPKLERLWYLNLERAMFQNPMLNCLAEAYGPDVEEILISKMRCGVEVARLLKKVKSLKVADINSINIGTLSAFLGKLAKRQEARASLEKLHLTLWASFPASDLYELLPKFYNLRSLQIDLRDDVEKGVRARIEDTTKNTESVSSSKLTALETLTMSLSLSQRKFGFLTSLPNLTNLILKEVHEQHFGVVAGEEISEIDEEIRKILARQTAANSKLWSLLPKLNNFAVEWMPELKRQNCEFKRDV